MNEHIIEAVIFGVALLIVIGGVGFVIFLKDDGKDEPYRIGVLLPLSGPDAVDSRDVLDWAAENVKDIGGHPVELVYRDTYDANIRLLARALVDDDSVHVVIGPGSSEDVYAIAPLFDKADKLLISPFSTSGAIYERFGGSGFFWRTCQSDVVQLSVMFDILVDKGARNVSLVYENSIYGSTFNEWIDVFAIQNDLNITGRIMFQPSSTDMSGVVTAALAGGTDHVICVAFSRDAAALAQAFAGKGVGLLFADAARTDHFLEDLGSASEGLEGTSPTYDPTSGFRSAFMEKFGDTPGGLAAPTYDAFLLSVYSLARFTYMGGDESITGSMASVVYGDGEYVDWDHEGVERAISLLLDGKTPNVTGTSGPLDFDRVYGVDPGTTYYSHWKVSGGTFGTLETISSTDA